MEQIRKEPYYKELPDSQRPLSPLPKDSTTEKAFMTEIEIFKSRLIRIHEKFMLENNHEERKAVLRKARSSDMYRKMVKNPEIFPFIKLPDHSKKIPNDQWYLELEAAMTKLEENIIEHKEQEMKLQRNNHRKDLLRKARSDKYYRKMVQYPKKYPFMPLTDVDEDLSEVDWLDSLEKASLKIKETIIKIDYEEEYKERLNHLKIVKDSAYYKQMCQFPERFVQYDLPAFDEIIPDNLWVQKMETIYEKIKAMVNKEQHRIQVSNSTWDNKEKLKNFKASPSYKNAIAENRYRPKTPEITGDPERDDLEISIWSKQIKKVSNKALREVRDQQKRDIMAMKDTLLYMQYAKLEHLGKVNWVPTPNYSACRYRLNQNELFRV